MNWIEALKFAVCRRCAECGELPSIYPAPNREYTVRCIHKEHSGFTKDLSYTEAYHRGIPIPPVIENVIELKERREMERRVGEEQEKALIPYYGVTALTQEQAIVVLRTIWPKAPDMEVFKAALLCKMYGLNPLMRHIYLIPFQNRKTGETIWSTILGIGATRLIVSRLYTYSYADGPRVMTTKEQKAIRGEIDDKNIWAITILKDSKGNVAPGYGSWPKGHEPYGADKGNTGENMAFIRSERQAFERLFPGEMPQGVEVGDIQYLSSTPARAAEQSELPF